MANYFQYTSALKLHQKTIQQQLDNLIEQFTGEPVGDGYIDIIIIRERYAEFIHTLTALNLAIECVSWWCHATDEHKASLGCPHGFGGPMTRFGWFSEMSFDFDEIAQEAINCLENSYTPANVKRINEMAAEIIRSKRTGPYPDGSYLEFQKDCCLTPGFWIYVPSDWRRGHN